MYCLHTNSFHYYSIEAAVEAAKQAHLSGLEIAAVKGWTEHIMPSFTEKRIEEIVEKCKGANLQIRSMSGHCDLRDPERRRDFIKNIELASRLGCKTIVTSSGEAHFGVESRTKDDIELIDGIKTALESCEKNELRLALETHGRYGSGEKLMELLAKVDHPLLGIAYDTANVVRHGGVLPENDILICAEKVCHVHLKDKIGEADGRSFTALGKGWIALNRVFQVLDSVRYRGDYSIEVEYFLETGAPKLDRVIQDILDSAAWLRSIGRI